MSLLPRPVCDICGYAAERPSTPCPCGSDHTVCVSCCFFIPGLLLPGSSLSTCPVTDEFRVALEMMGGP